jgi:hypothetical protein
MVSQHAAESSRAKLVTLSPTRWVERHESIIVMIEILDPPRYTLQEISTWQDTPVRCLYVKPCKPLIVILCLHEIAFLLSWRN